MYRSFRLAAAVALGVGLVMPLASPIGVAAAATALPRKVVVSVSNRAPLQGTKVTVSAKVLDSRGRRIKGAKVLFTWKFSGYTKKMYVTTPSNGTAKAARNIGSARAGYKVVVIAKATVRSRSVSKSTYFIPKAPAPPVSLDTTPPVTVSDAVASYSGNAAIHLTATDNSGGSGVAHTYYKLDGGAETEGIAVNVATAGSHSLEFWSVDASANVEAPRKTAGFTITAVTDPDLTAPVTASDGGTTYADSATIHLTATDNSGGSGVAHTYYKLDSGPQSEGVACTVSTPGAHNIEFWSVDNAGNVETPHKTKAFTVTASTPGDTVAPTTVSNIIPAKSYVGSSTLHLTATDNVGGSGVTHTYYKLDGGAAVDGFHLVLTVVGAHTAEFWSVDAAGNVESPHKTVSWSVAPDLGPDLTPPTTTSNAAASYTGNASIKLTGNDGASGSGIAHTYFILDGGAQVEGGTVNTAVVGSHHVEFWSVDVAGNVETPHKTADFSVAPGGPDVTPPTTTSDAIPDYMGSGGIAIDAIIHLSPTDNAGGSGVAHTYYKVDGGPVTEGVIITVLWSVVGLDTSHVVEWWSVDNAGNVESHTVYPFTITTPC